MRGLFWLGRWDGSSGNCVDGWFPLPHMSCSGVKGAKARPYGIETRHEKESRQDRALYYRLQAAEP